MGCFTLGTSTDESLRKIGQGLANDWADVKAMEIFPWSNGDQVRRLIANALREAKEQGVIEERMQRASGL